jgi:AcrR family transcriptional regulator
MGRPRTPLIDRDRIAAVALDLVDEQGDFSAPRIAGRLGVRTASLYHHVDGRDGIVELVRDRVASAIDGTALACEASEWEPAMARWARSYRAAFAAHPRAIPLLMASPIRAPEVLAQYERAVGLLLDAGFAPGDVLTVLTALEDLVLGSALELAAPPTMWAPSDSSDTPRLAEALAAAPASLADAAFELALGACLGRFRELLER